jgi:diaminopimelate epimerase
LIFWKYHGLGNDFMVVEDFEGTLPKDASFVRRVCDRRTGVGADGILYIRKGDGADASMRVLNSDGSEAEMCGNGIRCVAKHLYEFGLVKKEMISISTPAGRKDVVCAVSDGKVKAVTVEMGGAVLDCARIPMRCEGTFIDKEITVQNKRVRGTAVSMGNPHFVTFRAFSEDEMKHLGPQIEGDSAFPKRTNVEFATVKENKILVKVYERGAGWTMACGTGACATVVAAVVNKLVPAEKEMEVRLPGGSLWIEVKEDLSSVTMRGPAERVFKGELEE